MITSAGFAVAMPFVSLYLYEELGVPMKIVGTIMLIAALVGSAGRLIGGELTDRIGRKPLIALAMGLRVAAFLLMAYLVAIRAPYGLISLVFVAIRFVGALSMPAVSAMVADVVGPRRRVEAFGLLRIGGNAGWAIGPSVGGVLASLSYAYPFLVTALASLIALVLVLIFVRESIGTRESGHFRIGRVFDAGRDHRFLTFCALSLALFLVVGQLVSTFSVFAVSFMGISKVKLGYLYTLNGLIIVLFQYPATLFVERLGIRWSLVLGGALYTLGYLSVGFAPSFYLLLLSMAVITSGEIIFSPTSTAAVTEMSPARMRGRYLGFFGLAQAFGWSAGPFIGGVLLDGFPTSPISIWGTIASLGFIATVGFLWLARRSPVSRGESPICPSRSRC